MKQIDDEQLKKFCRWFAKRHQAVAPVCVVITAMCGHLHTYTKAAEAMVKRCVRLQLMSVAAGTATIDTKGDAP